MPSRRQVLALSGALLSAGCLTSDPAASTGDPSETPIGSRTGRGTETPCPAGMTVRLESFAPAEALPVEVGAAARSLVSKAVQQDAVEISTYGTAPIESGVFVTDDGSFYRLEYATLGSTEVHAELLNLEWERGQTAPSGAEVLEYANLPASDRRALRLAVYGPEYDSTPGHPQQRLVVEKFPAPYPDGAEASSLVGRGETWIRWNDRTYRVSVGGDTTTTRYSYRYRATEIASDAAAFREYVASNYLVELTDLSADQRALVESAIDGGQQDCKPISDALASLRSRLEGEPTLPEPYGESWYVEYDGRRYRLELERWVV